MTQKKFSIAFATVLLLFVGLNFVIWKSATEVLLTKKYDGGDLARMGYVIGSKQLRKVDNNLPVRHIGMKEYDGRKVDVLTIGDSFSMGGGEGTNSYYQDFIATINNCTVLNVYPYPTDDRVAGFSPISTLAVLLNSGYLDVLKPRYILIESVVRYCVPRFAKKLDLSRTDSPENIRQYYAKTTYGLDYLPKVGFINNGNFKFLYTSLLYHFSDSAFRGLVHRMQLDRGLFDAPEDHTLIFHDEDLTMIPYNKGVLVEKVNDTFNQLADVLAKRGIKLYFMPVVDKYDLYSDHIVDNPYPENPFFAELRKLPKKYTLIDTKAILQPMVESGVKDVFYPDDSHWTCNASKRVFETVRFP
ncbi:MAG: hypothetical protein PHO83_15090 [Geobacteraceae bacterium]|nr:hypothetical protein [Geobacteraceae bacterium]